MKFVAFVLLLLFKFTIVTEATTRVAFFEAYDHNGKVIRLLPESDYFHVAIQIEDVWYHTDQYEGVAVLKRLSDLGPQFKLKSLLASVDKALSTSAIEPFLKLPFNFYYDWDDPNTTYCSKLVANLLGVEPSVNLFESPYWSQAYGVKKGEKGISPDELFEKLSKNGFYLAWSDEGTQVNPTPPSTATQANTNKSTFTYTSKPKPKFTSMPITNNPVSKSCRSYLQ